jgi:tRNA G10  N-methylase Trm11
VANSLLSDGSAVTFIGVDQSPEQLKDAVLNIEAVCCRDQIRVELGDAGDLNLENGIVSAVLSCPPFGRQFGRGMDLRAMYRQWIGEWHRVLDPHGGRLALLVDVYHQEDALAAIWTLGDFHVLLVREPFRLGDCKLQ